MKTRASLMLVALCLTVLSAQPAAAVPILDQFYTDEAGYGPLGTVTAQTFTAGISGQLVEVDLRIGREGNTHDGDADPVVFIYAGNRPDRFGPSLGAITVPRSSFPDPISSGVYVSLDLTSQNIAVIAGNLYTIAVDQHSSQLNWGIGPQTFAGFPYPGGEPLFGNSTPGSGGWASPPFPNGLYDFNFKTFVNPIPEPPTVVLAGLAVLGLLGFGYRRLP